MRNYAYFNGTAWVTVPDTNSNTTYALTAASDNITFNRFKSNFN